MQDILASTLPTEDHADAPSFDFRDVRRVIDAKYQKYMGARQILSTLSESTLRRYGQRKSLRPRLYKGEQELLHQLVAVGHIYDFEGCGCTQGEAHFASALMAVASIECATIVGFILSKKRTRTSAVFKKLWKQHVNKSKKRADPRTAFASFLISLRLKDRLRIAREMGFYSESACPPLVVETLSSRGYTGQSALADFVQDARNCIHTKHCVAANERYAKVLDVMYSLEAIRFFHTDFALCAWELHGQITANLPRMRVEQPLSDV